MSDTDTTTLTISLPKTLRDRVAAAAEQDHRSISNFLRVLLDETVPDPDKPAQTQG